MWKATISGLRAHKLRLVLTALSVVLGVAFVTGTLILSDTLQNTFNQLFSGVYGKISVEVRQPSPVKDEQGNKTFKPMPVSILDKVQNLPGVAAAEGSVSGFAQIVDKHGKAIAPQAPTIGASYGKVREISGFTLFEGNAPVGPNQVVIDKGTTDKYGFHVGDTVRILFQGPPQQFTLSGIVKFGRANGLAGATVASFELPTAQQLLNRPGEFDNVSLLAKSGTSATSLKGEVSKQIPSGYEAITGTELAKETAKQVNKALGFFTTFLLIFALISLFVGSFIILNTFSILVAQRTRELALLRALGASRKQVLISTLGEAGVVGLIAAVVGIVAGAGVAAGLQAVFKATGVDLPSYGTVFKARTAIVALIIGVGVSLIASLNPARRASKIPPVAALGDPVPESAGSLGRRAILGTVALVIGVVVMLLGLFVSHKNQVAEVGIGIAMTFLAVATLAPIIARPTAGMLGRPLRRTGMAGVLARQNAMRNPRRTAATASALMVGLALVTMFSVFGQSAKASVNKTIDTDFSADFILKTSSFTPTISPVVEKQASAVPGVGAVSGERAGQVRYHSSNLTITGVDAGAIDKVVKVQMIRGTLASLGHGQLLVEDKTAKNKGWKVGTAVPLVFNKSGTQTLTVGGTFKANPLLNSNYVISIPVFEANVVDQLDTVVLVKVANGVDPATVRPHLEDAVASYPNVSVSDSASVKKDQAKQINQLLAIIYALLALAVIIAVLGIINTLVLSVVERRRELGLLRAIGMIRRQMRAMIRGESVIIALFGAILGLVIGLAFGWALTKAVLTNGIGGVVSVPVPSLIIFVILAALAGVLAAVWPARRAARTNVLAAITFD
jgi:putative ABC transport system permease protein